MSPELPPIQIRGARCHNLDGLDIDLPTGVLTLLRGASGAGKTSLAMHTLVAEGRRRMVALVLGERLPRPDVDAVLGLPPTVGVPASGPPGSSRGRVADATELGALVRAWARRHGAHRDRSGGLHRAATPDALIDRLMAHAVEGRGPRTTLLAPLDPPADPTGWLDEIRSMGFVRLEIDEKMVRLDELSGLPAGARIALVVDRLRLSPDRRSRLAESLHTALLAGRGRALARIEGQDAPLVLGTVAWDPETGEQWPAPTDALLSRDGAGACSACAGAGCGDCGGTGFGPLARALEVDGTPVADLLSGSLSALAQRLAAHPGDDVLQPAMLALIADHLALGLGHLSLGRPLRQLGSGERSRLRLLRAAREAGPGQLLVVDEPCARLGPDQRDRVGAWLAALRDRGVTLLVIDHAPDLGRIADHEVVFASDRSGRIAHAGTVQPRAPWPAATARPGPPPDWQAAVALGPGAPLSVGLARGRWTTICGPSGAGKTRLLLGALGPALAGEDPAVPVSGWTGPVVAVRQIERVASTRNPRSCVATHCKVWGPVRDLLARTREARIRGLGPEHFSFNRPEGRCAQCGGTGVETIELGTLATDTRTCPGCGGSRFARHLDEVRWRGHSLGDLMRLSAREGAELFAAVPRVGPALQSLVTVGLGYLPLGRPTRSLSTGETQRLHLARLLTEGRRAARDGAVVLLADGVDVGLGDEDADVLCHALAALRDEGHTLVTVSYHPLLAQAADQVVVLPGPISP